MLRFVAVLMGALLLGGLLGVLEARTGLPVQRLIPVALGIYLAGVILWQFLRHRGARRKLPGHSPTGDQLRRLANEVGWEEPVLERRQSPIPLLAIQRGRLLYSESISDLLDEVELRSVLLYGRQPGFASYMKTVTRTRILLGFSVIAAVLVMILSPQIGAPLALVAAGISQWWYARRPIARGAMRQSHDEYLAAGGDPLVWLRANYKMLAVYIKHRILRGVLITQERLELEWVAQQIGLSLAELRAIGQAVGAPPSLLLPQSLYRPGLWLGLALLGIPLFVLLFPR